MNDDYRKSYEEYQRACYDDASGNKWVNRLSVFGCCVIAIGLAWSLL